MFNRIKAFFIKQKLEKAKKESEKVYTLSHILLVLFNNIKTMRGIGDKQKMDVYNLYVQTLHSVMSPENKILFIQAANETTKAIGQIYANVPPSEIQIKRQLEEIFREAGSN